MDALIRWEYWPQAMLVWGVVFGLWLCWKAYRQARGLWRDYCAVREKKRRRRAQEAETQALLRRLAEDKARWESAGGRVYRRGDDDGRAA